MAKAYVSEYGFAGSQLDNLPIALEPAIAEQVVTFTTTTQSAAFSTATRLIRVHVDSICSLLVGSNPTATTSCKRMNANTTEYFFVGQGQKIAFVTNT